jgi:hypothetical protein
MSFVMSKNEGDKFKRKPFKIRKFSSRIKIKRGKKIMK